MRTIADGRRERWLLTGGAGQLGGYVARALRTTRSEADIIVLPRLTEHHHPDHVDIYDLVKLNNVLERHRPTHVVHLAGTSSPAVAETAPEQTAQRERAPVECLTEFAARTGCWLMVPSTDFVWAGDPVSQPYRESDTPAPINAYGAIKLSVERVALDAGVGMVGRFSLMFGRPLQARQTTWTRIVDSLLNGDLVTACTDEHRSPVSLSDAAAVVVGMGAVRYEGLLHIAGPESLTGEQMIERLADFLEVEPALKRVSRVDLTPGVRRPANVTMDSARLRDLAPDLLPHGMNAAALSDVFGSDRALRKPSAPRRRKSADVLGIVIPAYHGAHTLHRSLESIGDQDFRGSLQVVVAVNDGLTETADAAHRMLAPIRDAGADCTVVETERGRRSALNFAEKILSTGPRLYLDQDARLSRRSLTELFEILRPTTSIEFAALRPQIAPSSRRLIRAYYDAWCDLPYVRESPATMGAYAVSANGRGRWTEFPEIHSDDKFVRLQFAPAERAVVDASYEVLAPDSLPELIRARRRYIRGNRELDESGLVDIDEEGHRRYTDALHHLIRNPSKLPTFALFSAIYGAAATSERWRGDVTASR